MPTQLHVPDSITIGDAVDILVITDEPLTVTVSCFYNEPPPPGFGPCAECTVQMLRAGEHTIQFMADEATWRDKSGEYRVQALSQGRRVVAEAAIRVYRVMVR